LAGLLHQFTDWYLSTLSQGGYWLIAGLMALESTVVPIPSEVIIPPAAYLAHTQGQLSLPGVVLAGTLGSWAGATLMYWAARWLGRPVVMRLGPYVGIAAGKVRMAEAWCAHYGAPGVFFSRLLPLENLMIAVVFLRMLCLVNLLLWELVRWRSSWIQRCLRLLCQIMAEWVSCLV